MTAARTTSLDAAIDRYGPERAGVLAAFGLFAAGTTLAVSVPEQPAVTP